MSDYSFGSVLKRLQADQSTGSLVCVGEDSVFGRVYVADGKPVLARCGSLKGKDAMQRLNDTTLTSVKFHDGVKLISSGSDAGDIEAFKPDENTVIADNVSHVESGAAPDVDALIGAGDVAALEQKKLSAPIREILTEELIEYAGPIASMFVDGLEDDISLAQALKLLALEIGDEAQAKKFVAGVRQKI